MEGLWIALNNPSPSHTAAAKAVEDAVGHSFYDRSLFDRALTHSSISSRGVKDLERLEFLGDRVLGLLTAEELWRRFPTMDEGQLAPRLNALVRKETCADAARFWQMGPALVMSDGEDRSGGRNKNAILGDACEALLGALYIDGGLEAARRAFDSFWGPHFEGLVAQHRDPKSALQEWAQDKGLGTPAYHEIGREGPDHAPRFTVRVKVGNLPTEEAAGASKQAAQMSAAEAVLRREKVWTDEKS